VVDHGNPAVMHGAKANTSVPCTNDAEVLEGLLQVIPGHEFSFGRFTALADALGCKCCRALLTSTMLTALSFRVNTKGDYLDTVRTTSPRFTSLSDIINHTKFEYSTH
jgi:hypothetical protein